MNLKMATVGPEGVRIPQLLILLNALFKIKLKKLKKIFWTQRIKMLFNAEGKFLHVELNLNLDTVGLNMKKHQF